MGKSPTLLGFCAFLLVLPCKMKKSPRQSQRRNASRFDNPSYIRSISSMGAAPGSDLSDLRHSESSTSPGRADLSDLRHSEGANADLRHSKPDPPTRKAAPLPLMRAPRRASAKAAPARANTVPTPYQQGNSAHNPAPVAHNRHSQEEQLRANAEMALEGDANRVQVQHTRAADLRRGKSQLSIAALTTLCDLSDKLDGYETQVENVLSKLTAPGAQIGAIKAELGQLYGNIDKMLNCQVDAVSTAELTSGKDDARALRKALVVRAQKTLDKIQETNSSLHV